jgi:hypothetical protein
LFDLNKYKYRAGLSAGAKKYTYPACNAWILRIRRPQKYTIPACNAWLLLAILETRKESHPYLYLFKPNKSAIAACNTWPHKYTIPACIALVLLVIVVTGKERYLYLYFFEPKKSEVAFALLAEVSVHDELTVCVHLNTKIFLQIHEGRFGFTLHT